MTDPAVTLAVVLLGALGLVVGSFLNVVIARVPSGASIVRPRSACPRCGAPITARDNVPLLSWLILRGRCRDCRGPISVRYPLVELLTGVLWAATASWCLVGGDLPHLALLPTLLVVGSAGVALISIDIDHQRLPDVIVLPLYPLVGIGLVGAGLLSGDWPIERSLASAALWLAAVGGIWLVSRGRAMGLGDVKLAPLLGLVLGWIGWGPAVIGLGSAWIAGGCVAAALLATRRAGRRQAVAFGPFLIIGFWLGSFLGAPLLDAYLCGFGLAPIAGASS